MRDPYARHKKLNGMPMQNIETETVPIDQINEAAYNPRVDLKPGDPRYDRLKASMEEFGCVEFLIWNRQTGNLVGGHQRLKILKAEGVESVQVSVVDLPPEKEKALNLSLNKNQGDWNEQKLAELVSELVEVPDLDFEVTGFDFAATRDWAADLLGDAQSDQNENFDVDGALDAAGEPVTQPGDIIELGRHRLMCGDATDPTQVAQLMNGEQAALFATDPPYLVGYDGTNHPGSSPSKRRKQKDQQTGDAGNATTTAEGRKDWSGSYGVTWDDADAQPDLYENFIHAAIEAALRPNAPWYCWYASKNHRMLENIWERFGAFVHCQIIWFKNKGVPTRTWYLWQHEPCLMGWVQGNMPPRIEDKHLSTVWQFDTLPNGEDRPDHPTPKPIEVFEIPMRQHTQTGEVCYEPFAGSGTQFIAAQRMRRRCFGMEISPQYCDLIVRRFISFAGESAVARDVAERYRLDPEQSASSNETQKAEVAS